MAKGTNIINKFTNSIYNVKEFSKYMKEGVRKAILYALILSTFIGGIKGIAKGISFNNSSNEAIKIMSEEKYKFSINNGNLYIENSPLKIEDNNILIYIDNNININEDNTLRNITVNEDSYILLLKDGIVFESNVNPGSDVNKIKSTYKELNIADGTDNTALIKILKAIKVPIMIVISIIFIIQEFIAYLFTALMLAIFSLFPSRILGVNLKIRELFSLVVYAATLPSVLVLILTVLIPNVPFNTAGMIGTALYTYIILNDISKEVKDDRDMW